MNPVLSPAAITPEVVREHGLTPEEYDKIRQLLGREPRVTELGIFSVMWSEHCSYKSSKVHLRQFGEKQTEAAKQSLLVGIGENAGVVEIGGGWVTIFKMESHNHPSFIEPYQGAATGVGGILRDVFTMGARPIMLLDSLRFGALDAPRMRHLVDGVVRGIGDYGNCVGVPTVGGEVMFHPSYNGNCLVNAMCAGLVRTDQIVRAKAAGPYTRYTSPAPSFAYAAVLPGGKPQERVLTIAGWLARFGKVFLDDLGCEIDAWYATLAVVEVSFDDQPDAFRNINTREELRDNATPPT